MSELPARQHTPLTSAVRRLVLASWRLDQYGDLGDREKITQAHHILPRRSRTSRQLMRLANRPTLPDHGRLARRGPGDVPIVALLTPAHRSAQGDHVAVQLQRSHLPDPARPVRPLPLRGRADADVAAHVQRRAALGRVDARAARSASGCRPWYADPDGSGGEGRPHRQPARARHDHHVGHRRHAAGRSREEAGAGARRHRSGRRSASPT